MTVCCDISLCFLFNDQSIDKIDAVTDEWTNTSPRRTKALEEIIFLLPAVIPTANLTQNDLRFNSKSHV